MSSPLQFKTKIVFVPRVDNVDLKSIKGKNHLSYANLKKHYLFKEEDEVDRDCTLFLGYEPGSLHGKVVILLLRFHKFKPVIRQKNSKDLLKELEGHDGEQSIDVSPNCCFSLCICVWQK